LLSTSLTQFDKLLLTKILTLDEYGYYALASVVAGVLLIVPQPISQAIFPKLNELYERRNDGEIANLFHLGAQVITVLLASVAGVLFVFTDYIMNIWIDDGELVSEISLLVKILVIGNMANGLMAMPYHLQLTYGWTKLSFYVNLFSILYLFPAMIWLVPLYGAPAAACIWVSLNFGYILVTPYFMHRRLLSSEKWRWYIRDIFVPVIVAFVLAFSFKGVVYSITNELAQFLIFLVSALMVLVLCVHSAPLVRALAYAQLKVIRS